MTDPRTDPLPASLPVSLPAEGVSLRRPRSLAQAVVDDVTRRVREGVLRPGDKLPTEGQIMAAFGVSRTVVREALSKLQASGVVQTKHGIGTFVVGVPAAPTFRLEAEQLATVREVIALLDLRIGVETEAAGLAALRREPANLHAMRQALLLFNEANEASTDAVGPDFQFHLEIARATQNSHFTELMTYLGTVAIPRTRVNTAGAAQSDRQEYLRRVNGEHESILNAIAQQDPDAARAAMRTHLSNSRERLRRAHADAGEGDV